MHVTVAFSKKPVTWDQLQPADDHVHIAGGQRSISPLGDKGAVVLHFDHPSLHERWQHFIDNGASWDHDGYRPHVTLTYDGGGLPLDQITPYPGPLVFGPEEFEPLDENWDKKISEVPLVIEKRGIFPIKLASSVKYDESIMEIHRMTELSNLLMKNIDLILEAYNVDEKGNLVVANRHKVAEADDVFHEFFVNNMNQMFRRLNENDPIMQQPMGMGMAPHGHDMGGMGGGEMMGDMSPMGHPHEMGGHNMDGGDGMYGDESMLSGGEPAGDGMGGGHMGGGQMHGGMGGGHHMGDHMSGGMGGSAPAGGMGAMGESTDWLFNENVDDIDINSMFDITEDEQQDDENLNEFGGMGAMGGMGDEDPMGMSGGSNDFGGDMGGIASDPMGDDMGGGGMGGDPMGGMGGGDEGMVTIHGETDAGSPFEFKFNPETLGMGDDMGGEGGEHHHGGHGGHGEHHGGSEHDMGSESEPGMGSDDDEPPVAEAAGGFHNGKPGRGRKGGSSSRMSIVPQDPRASHAAPFPTPQGGRQKH